MISNEFKENVSSGEVFLVRSALLDSLTDDKSFNKFENEIEYAKRHMEILESFIEDKDNNIKQNPEEWDENYLNLQKVALMDNFSQERIDNLKKVIKKVLPTINTSTKQENETSNRTGRRTLSVETEPISDNNTTEGENLLNRVKNFFDKKRKDPNNVHDIMIVGGLIVATTGVATAGVGALVTKPVIVKAGWSVAGVGSVLTVSGIVGKNLKSK